MMVEEHPTAEQLTAFGLGKLNDAESMALEAHLAECETCRLALETQAADSFVALARVVRAEERTSASVPAQGLSPCAPTCALTDTTAPAPTDVPPELANHPRYRILGLIGVGGMGAVFKAEHLLMHRVVALKMINRRLVANPSMVERFTREVIAAGNLSHPNIVHYHDAEHIGDTHFLVMEYVEGINLAKLMAETGPLPIAQACDYIRQAALGLQHAFERGMVHRDIKPQNLMVVQPSRDREGAVDAPLSLPLIRGSEVVKILDFGLARLAQETAPVPVEPAAETTVDSDKPTPSGALTQIGTVMGTPDYIAPEQARDAHAADIRSDIYSLGCTLYDLLTGEPPFPEGTVMQKVIAHLERPPRPVTELRADAPPALARIAEKMLAKDPAQRYQTPAEVAAALAPFINEIADERPVVAAAPPRRRLRFSFAASLVIALTVIGSLFFPPIQDFAQTVIRIATNKGVLEIVADDEDLEIAIKQTGQEPRVEIVHNKTKRLIELTAVDGQIQARELREGLRGESRNFQLTRGGKVSFTARMLLANARPVPGDNLKKIGEAVQKFQALPWFPDADSELLQGRWIPTAAEKDGKPQPKDLVVTFVQHLDFIGDKMCFTKDRKSQEGVFKLDPTQNPKWIDVTRQEGPGRFGVLAGIYELDGNTLKLCMGEPENARPKEFASLPGTRVLYLTLHREMKVGGDFQPLFNGKDLSEWKGTNSLWTVEDGELIARIKGKNVPASQIILPRKVKDFELRFQARLKNAIGGCMVGFRMFETEQSPSGFSLLLRESNWGSLMSDRSGHEVQLSVKKANVRGNEYNDCILRCEGKKITLQINGETICHQREFPDLPGEGVFTFMPLNHSPPDQGKDVELRIRNLQLRELNEKKEPAFQPLFNGKDLDGWEGNNQAWSWKDGLLIANTGHLRSKMKFTDFELKFHARLKGGKGKARLEFRKGEKATGLGQIAWGSVVGMGGREWGSVSGKPSFADIEKFIKADDFNEVFLRCVGGRVTVHVNGLKIVDSLEENVGTNGVFAWNVWEGTELTLKDILIRELPAVRYEPAFRPLFNGKDLTGWVPFSRKKDLDPKQAFLIDGNVLMVEGQKRHGFLRTEKMHENYELEFEFRVPPLQKQTAGCLLLLHLQPDNIFGNMVSIETNGEGFIIGPDRKDFEFKIKGKPQRDGGWNRVHLACKGHEIGIRLNGEDLGIAKCKNTELRKGFIAIVSGENEVHYRNVQIRALRP
jgi:uncharacterized protein (TIGR03067 family)